MFLLRNGRRERAFHATLQAIEAHAIGQTTLGNDALADFLIVVSGGFNRRLARKRCAYIMAQYHCAIAERLGHVSGFHASAMLDSEFETIFG